MYSVGNTIYELAEDLSLHKVAVGDIKEKNGKQYRLNANKRWERVRSPGESSGGRTKAKVGDTKEKNGKQYRFNANKRWERVKSSSGTGSAADSTASSKGTKARRKKQSESSQSKPASSSTKGKQGKRTQAKSSKSSQELSSKKSFQLSPGDEHLEGQIQAAIDSSGNDVSKMFGGIFNVFADSSESTMTALDKAIPVLRSAVEHTEASKVSPRAPSDKSKEEPPSTPTKEGKDGRSSNLPDTHSNELNISSYEDFSEAALSTYDRSLPSR